jgi:hypothetical protein
MVRKILWSGLIVGVAAAAAIDARRSAAVTEAVDESPRAESPPGGVPPPPVESPEPPVESTRPPVESSTTVASTRTRRGPNPFVVVGVALFLGVALAKWIDWRGHGHPRW